MWLRQRWENVKERSGDVSSGDVSSRDGSKEESRDTWRRPRKDEEGVDVRQERRENDSNSKGVERRRTTPIDKEIGLRKEMGLREEMSCIHCIERQKK